MFEKDRNGLGEKMRKTITQEGMQIDSFKESIGEKELYDFLRNVDKDFPEPLSDRVDLKEYSKKMYENAVIITEIYDEQIVGMFAGYANDEKKEQAYVSFVSVVKEYRGSGIAKKLLSAFIEICRKKGFREVGLHTSLENQGAIRLYESNGFEREFVTGNRAEYKYKIEE